MVLIHGGFDYVTATDISNISLAVKKSNRHGYVNIRGGREKQTATDIYISVAVEKIRPQRISRIYPWRFCLCNRHGYLRYIRGGLRNLTITDIKISVAVEKIQPSRI